ncbi:MAG: LysR family transcriptional regulator [Salinisphaeraceae bacterium]
MSIANFDLNLLRVFDAMMREQHVTRAAERLFLTQSAVSNALSRLRTAFHDELFVRRPEGMVPTPRALELESPVRAALLDIEQALAPTAFDPATSEWTFRLVANDYFSTVVMPPLITRLRQDAPGVDLRLLPHVDQPRTLLDTHRADFAFGSLEPVEARFGAADLLTEDFLCLMRPDHPLSQGKLTPERFATADHLLVSPSGHGDGVLDRDLARLGLSRRVVLTINQFAAAPAVVAASDLVVTLLRRVAERFAADAGLITRPAPFKREPMPIRLVWHQRLARHPAHDWFRDTVRDVTAAL